MLRLQFKTDEERLLLIENNLKSGLHLIREENITQGTFLTFDETPLKTNPELIMEYKNENTILKQEIATKDIIISEKESLLQVKEVELQEAKAVDKGILQKG